MIEGVFATELRRATDEYQGHVEAWEELQKLAVVAVALAKSLVTVGGVRGAHILSQLKQVGWQLYEKGVDSLTTEQFLYIVANPGQDDDMSSETELDRTVPPMLTGQSTGGASTTSPSAQSGAVAAAPRIVVPGSFRAADAFRVSR